MSAAVSVTSETSNGVATIRLGADGGIFLTNGLCAELEQTLQAAASDASVRVIILTGANPGVFMRHYSVTEILQISANLRASGFKPGDPAPPHADAPIDRCIRLCETMDKPVIAAINGECMGGAMEIALGCDLRIAQSGDFRLGQPETMLGILPGAGGTQRLARVIGPAQAMAHALIGMPIGPDEAFRLGMVHALAPDALAAAQARAAHFIAIPAPALAHVKRLVRESETLPLAEGLKLERALFLDLAVRPESIALMEAYEAGKHPLSRPV